MTETKKMYSYRHGIVDVFVHAGNPHILMYANKAGQYHHALLNGKIILEDDYPSLISLEQAEKQGLVKRVEDTSYRGLCIKYSDLFGAYTISKRYYLSKMEFLKENDARYTFVSFVDKQLNVCPPPKEAVLEWVEVSQ